jgi:hypothetical protein
MHARPLLAALALAAAPVTMACSRTPSFDYDPALPAGCKANVEFLVTCAGKKQGAQQKDMLEKARVMQKAQLEDTRKSGPAVANKRCSDLGSFVRSNPSCK